jgi:hypothetical protein
MAVIRNLEQQTAPGVFLYVERSRDASKLFSALCLAQGQFEEPRRNRKGQYGEYADLASLRKATRQALAGNGLFLMQTFHLLGDELVLNTTLGHSTGEYVSSQVPIKTATNPQQTAAYVTYMRRMAYSAMLSLSSEDDDDGEGAAAASVSSEVENWDAQFARAQKKLNSCVSSEAVDELMDRVAEKVRSKAMAPDAVQKLQTAANARKAMLSRRDLPQAKPAAPMGAAT